MFEVDVDDQFAVGLALTITDACKANLTDPCARNVRGLSRLMQNFLNMIGFVPVRDTRQSRLAGLAQPDCATRFGWVVIGGVTFDSPAPLLPDAKSAASWALNARSQSAASAIWDFRHAR